MRRNQKTPSQMRSELAYYTRIAGSSRSADRVRRARNAIERLDRELYPPVMDDFMRPSIFRKKPVEIVAVQFTGTSDSGSEIAD